MESLLAPPLLVRQAAVLGDVKSRGLTGNAGSAVPYRAARSPARHTRDASRCPWPTDPGFRRVQHHRNDCLLRHMHRERDRATHCAANKPCPDHSQLFHEILPSLQDAATDFASGATSFSASAVQRTGFLGWLKSFLSCPLLLLLDEPQPPKTNGGDDHDDKNGVLDHRTFLSQCSMTEIGFRFSLGR